ncbi:hypothetical protein R6Q59_028330 [Mikania micrantha]
MGRGEYRTNYMISSKWRDMNQKVRRFNGIYSQKWQTSRSGQSGAMIELESEDQYREEFNAPFTLKRSWELMRKCPNWIRIPTVQTSTSKRSKASSTDSPGTSDARIHINLNDLDEEEEDVYEIEDLTRPIVIDRAKTDRARTRRGSSSQTTSNYNQGIEHLSQRIGDFNELKRERQRLLTIPLSSPLRSSSHPLHLHIPFRSPLSNNINDAPLKKPQSPVATYSRTTRAQFVTGLTDLSLQVSLLDWNIGLCFPHLAVVILALAFQVLL